MTADGSYIGYMATYMDPHLFQAREEAEVMQGNVSPSIRVDPQTARLMGSMHSIA